MKVDQYGQIILSQQDLCEVALSNPDQIVKRCLSTDDIMYHSDLDLGQVTIIHKYIENNISVEEFDKLRQESWKMPSEYYELDIAKWILDQCTSDTERQRVGQELLLFLERDMFSLLKYLKYLVDTMRKYNVVWGVGRGSAVSSYVLFLIGVHKIDSIYYDLDINEFLR